MPLSRREFLSGAAGVVSVSSALPSFLMQACLAADSTSTESVLVVIQLSGGNDGLNTVVPFKNELYRKARPTLAVAQSDVLKIRDDLGFHPAARGLADLLEGGRLGIVQGVGYPEPNRSHFESMDIWHTCRRKNETRSDGWLGRFLSATRKTKSQPKSGGGVAAVHLGPEKQPLALVSQDVPVPSIKSLDRFRLNSDAALLRDAVAELTAAPAATDNGLLNFVQASTQSALAASRRVEAAGTSYKPAVSYPESGLAQKLRTVAQLIDAGLQTRVYYVTLDGFDTHSQQAAAHAGLLRQLSDALAAFVSDLDAHGHGDRVATLAFSEFGRRLAENASEGTDHGAAAPLFVAGNRVRTGLIGEHPGLDDLLDGDVKFHTDFRQVYAGLLTDWLKVDSGPIVGAEYQPVALFRT
jgi:uncharacterized protein (DUF1501 family)